MRPSGRYLTSVIKKRSIVFLISDFLGDGFDSAMKIANRKHDLVALKISDKAEKELPNVGLIPVKDNETDEVVWLDTSDQKTMNRYKAQMLRKEDELRQIFSKSGVDFAEIATHQSYVKPLMNLFKKSFLRKKIKIAQILLTLEDTENRRRSLNAKDTISNLFEMNIVPIVNENDCDVDNIFA